MLMIEDLVDLKVLDYKINENDPFLTQKHLEVGVNGGHDLQPVVSLHVLVIEDEVDVHLDESNQEGFEE